jgi:alginate O-acetyltransferase complex protein AlgI
MLFYEAIFSTIFFPTLYAIYLALRERVAARKWTLLIGSALFYTWGEPLFVPVLLVSSLIDYRLSLALHPKSPGRYRRGLLAFGIVTNLGILGFYKYANFVAANLNLVLGPLAGTEIPLLRIALPIGVSFVVFEKITYLIDTYRGTSTPAPSFLEYCLFVFFFPKLLAGPILKYHEMQRQIAAPAEVVWSDFWSGFLRLATGMAKKLLIADPLGTYSDRIFATDPAGLTVGSAWLGLACFSMQIYFDFSGYSDMAIGLARMLGFQLRENFDMPFASRSLTEFWQRWHISLSTWIRDYLYVPLGRYLHRGQRRGEWRVHVNLWICFVACGLWHGAAWTFVLWGAYQALFLSLDRLFLVRALERCGTFVATAMTVLIIMVGLAIFRSPSLDYFAGFAFALVDWSRVGWPTGVPAQVAVVAVIGALLCLLPATPAYGWLLRLAKRAPPLYRVAEAALVVLYVLAASRAFGVAFKPFIYFRF